MMSISMYTFLILHNCLKAALKCMFHINKPIPYIIPVYSYLSFNLGSEEQSTIFNLQVYRNINDSAAWVADDQ